MTAAHFWLTFGAGMFTGALVLWLCLTWWDYSHEQMG